jgi:hypothetical protein
MIGIMPAPNYVQMRNFDFSPITSVHRAVDATRISDEDGESFRHVKQGDKK